MAHFTYTRPSGLWDVGPLEPEEMADLDQKTEKAINGDDGGTWNPATKITVGGSGLYVPTDFSAGDIGGRSPALRVAGSQVTLPLGADMSFSSGSTVSIPSGAAVTLAGTGKIQGPGGGFVVTDGQPHVYNPPRAINHYPCPHNVAPYKPPAAGDVYASDLWYRLTPAMGKLYYALFLPQGFLINTIAISIVPEASGPGGTPPSLVLISATESAPDGVFTVSTTKSSPVDVFGNYSAPGGQADISLSVLNGAFPSPVQYAPSSAFRLVLTAPTAGAIRCGFPFLYGTLSELGSL